jgi:pyruvate/2-oxoglutarate/acetoin dehydrogenase E1 component
MNEAAAPALATLTYREACRQALREALQADPRCILLGEDVGLYGGLSLT